MLSKLELIALQRKVNWSVTSKPECSTLTQSLDSLIYTEFFKLLNFKDQQRIAWHFPGKPITGIDDELPMVRERG